MKSRWPFSRTRHTDTAETAPSGCGAAVFTCLVSMLFLLLNVMLVQAAYTVLTAVWPGWTREPRIAQAAVLLGPIVLLMAEWWLVELFADQLAGRSDRNEHRSRKRRKRVTHP